MRGGTRGADLPRETLSVARSFKPKLYNSKNRTNMQLCNVKLASKTNAVLLSQVLNCRQTYKIARRLHIRINLSGVFLRRHVTVP